MDRVGVGLLLCFITELLTPSWKLVGGNLSLRLFVHTWIFVTGFIVYQPHIFRDNLRNLGKRWRWYVREEHFFRYVVGFSWLFAAFSLTEVWGRWQTFSVWASRALSLQLFVLMAATAIFLGLILFADDEKETRKIEEWNEKQGHTSFWTGFSTLQYLFPIALVCPIVLAYKHGLKAVADSYTKVTYRMRAFAREQGLSASANESQYCLWWLKTLTKWVVNDICSIVKLLMKTIVALISTILWMIGKVLHMFLLRPMGDSRIPLVLLEVSIFLVYARASKYDPMPYLLGGILFSGLHVTFGYWLADRIEESVDKLID